MSRATSRWLCSVSFARLGLNPPTEHAWSGVVARLGRAIGRAVLRVAQHRRHRVQLAVLPIHRRSLPRRSLAGRCLPCYVQIYLGPTRPSRRWEQLVLHFHATSKQIRFRPVVDGDSWLYDAFYPTLSQHIQIRRGCSGHDRETTSYIMIGCNSQVQLQRLSASCKSLERHKEQRELPSHSAEDLPPFHIRH